MAFESMLTKMGSGMKHLTDRYADYSIPPVHEQHVYAYGPPAVPHEASSKHHYGSGQKNNAAMNALTLLAFLFFLHILQQCIKEHTMAMNTPQITIMTAGREGEDAIRKSNDKLDKSGQNPDPDWNYDDDDKTKNLNEETKYITKINTAKPSNADKNYMHTKDFDERRLEIPGFVNAMTD